MKISVKIKMHNVKLLSRGARPLLACHTRYHYQTEYS
jgi:hypothetical protein